VKRKRRKESPSVSKRHPTKRKLLGIYKSPTGKDNLSFSAGLLKGGKFMQPISELKILEQSMAQLEFRLRKKRNKDEERALGIVRVLYTLIKEEKLKKKREEQDELRKSTQEISG
jgi:predicted transcriptional regulator